MNTTETGQPLALGSTEGLGLSAGFLAGELQALANACRLPPEHSAWRLSIAARTAALMPSHIWRDGDKGLIYIEPLEDENAHPRGTRSIHARAELVIRTDGSRYRVVKSLHEAEGRTGAARDIPEFVAEYRNRHWKA